MRRGATSSNGRLRLVEATRARVHHGVTSRVGSPDRAVSAATRRAGHAAARVVRAGCSTLFAPHLVVVVVAGAHPRHLQWYLGGVLVDERG